MQGDRILSVANSRFANLDKETICQKSETAKNEINNVVLFKGNKVLGHPATLIAPLTLGLAFSASVIVLVALRHTLHSAVVDNFVSHHHVFLNALSFTGMSIIVFIALVWGVNKVLQTRASIFEDRLVTDILNVIHGRSATYCKQYNKTLYDIRNELMHGMDNPVNIEDRLHPPSYEQATSDEINNNQSHGIHISLSENCRPSSITIKFA